MEDKSRNPPPHRSPSATVEIIRLSQPQDYDGHTGFAQLSPAARLRWMEAALEFIGSTRDFPTGHRPY